ncbi:Tfp pilus assembly protein PilF [Paenibacillus sp. DS2015]|uniref:tetratricopeptide repeat protein n=1 Tax=Paenibacillus sp. DS2015 TaxID=3373917 RepID=UPI003D1FBB78
MTLHNNFYIGMIHLKNNEFEQAREFFQQITDAEPGNAEAHAWLAATYGRLMEFGSMLEKIALLPVFEREVATALELNSELVLARQVNGLRLLLKPKDFGGDPEQAVRELEYVIENGVYECEVFYLLGLAYLATEDEVRAANAFTQALECDPEHLPAQQQIEFLHQDPSH